MARPDRGERLRRLRQWYNNAPLRTKFSFVFCSITFVVTICMSLALVLLYATQQRDDFANAVEAEALTFSQIIQAHPLNGSEAATLSLLRNLSSQVTTHDLNVSVCLVETMENFGLKFKSATALPALAEVDHQEVASCSGGTFSQWDAGSYEVGRLVSRGETMAVAYLGIEADAAVLLDRVLALALLLLFAVLATVALASLVAYRMQGAILRPLGALQRVSNSILASADYDQRVAVEGDDEIGALVETYNKMLSTIAQRRKERDKALATLDRLANFDGLTHLPNRNASLRTLNDAVAAARRNAGEVAAMYIDLDNFKLVNDSLGHEAGDALLLEAAGRLNKTLGDQGVLGRLGGDEFLIIAAAPDGQLSDDRLGELASKCIAALAKPFTLSGHVVSTRASIGIARFPQHADDGDVLLKMADGAMYKAKEDGRDTYRFFDEKINKRNQRRHMIATDLRIALRERQMQVAYQPIVQVDNHQIVGAEALLRWHHPQFRMIGPAEFVPVAESAGLINQLGIWVIEQVCILLKRLQSGAMPFLANDQYFRIAVNLSAVQFRQDDLFETIENIMLEHGVSPSRLRFEVTESIFMDELNRASSVIARLRKIGCGVSIDDFGTGYSSLSYLSKLPVDTLKIDRSFVNELSSYYSSLHEQAQPSVSGLNQPDPRQAQAIALAILSLAKNLGMHVVAEGVEHLDQLRFLKEHGCDSVQGYLFGKPMPERDFIDFISRKK
ncbi:putative bifunctional diguanylate cyclase/phosphodiesterase [Allohahella sp. A8]|uniref:putative bifunctional diguanylate cyclase/phosphodiesterase n=1 Tax=Allohahella sp. A8 TaxID=3141461 RepID=UPI003A80BEEE